MPNLHRPQQPSHVKIYLSFVFASISLALSLTSQVFAQQSVSQLPQENGEVRDYLFPNEISAGAGSVRVLKSLKGEARPSAEQGASEGGALVETLIEYKSFFGVTHTLHAFSGRYVRWAFPDSWLGADGLSQDEIQRLVDITDLHYTIMVEIVGAEPAGEGLFTAAVVDPGGGAAGRGSLGAKALRSTLIPRT